MALETAKIMREIPAVNFDALVAEVEKLNKRAARLKLEPMRLEVVNRYEVDATDHRTKLDYKLPMLTVELSGECPKLAGWELIARITPTEAGNLAKSVPGKECPAEFRSVSTERCDHCNTARRRNDVFVVFNEDKNEYKVVGRNCIADFLGHTNPDALLNSAENLWSGEEIMEAAGDEGWGFGFGGIYHVPIEKFLGTTSLWVRRFGWVPRSKAIWEGSATADEVWIFLTDPKAKNYKFVEKNSLYVEDSDKEIAEKALAWAREIPADTKSDYLYNLKIACSLETVTWKTVGLTASAIAAYKRHVEREEMKRREKKDKRRGHVGSLKERRGFPDLTVIAMKHIDGNYGVKTLVKFENEAGDILVWWASGDVSDDWEIGDTYDVTGTVKKHEDHETYGKSTVFNRVVKGIDEKKFDETGAPRAKKSRKNKKSAGEKPTDGTIEGVKPDADGSYKNVPGTSVDFKVESPEKKETCSCGGKYFFANYCGAKVCVDCGNHKGLARCFCGWSASGGDGRRELLEMGETIDPE